jgi:hypothetical protein
LAGSVAPNVISPLATLDVEVVGMYEMPIVSAEMTPALNRLSVTVGTLDTLCTVPSIGDFRNNGIYWDHRTPTSREVYRAYAILDSFFRMAV